MTNIKRMTICAAMLLALIACEDTYTPSTKKQEPATNLKDGLYLGLVGFNNAIDEKGLELLNSNNITDYLSFIDNLGMESGSVLYHAVNHSVDKLVQADLPDNTVSVAIVTFTDGLDQGSFMLNPDFNSGYEYLSSVSRRVHYDTVKGMRINAYAIGTKGIDVTDEVQFAQNLQYLASNSFNALEIENMSEAEEKFQDVAASLSKSSTHSVLELTIPAPDPGTKVRFTFDAITNADDSEVYLEGVVAESNGKFGLSDLIYNGVSSEADSVILAEIEGINLTFSFTGFAFDATQSALDSKVQQWSYNASKAMWQINSEFDETRNSETIVETQSAAIILVLDCSSSLGTDFEVMKDAAKSFIDALLVE